MKYWRITKYGPGLRDVAGRYLRSDWTSVSDVGKVFSGEPLSINEYLRVETAYVETAYCFAQSSGFLEFTAVNVERSLQRSHDEFLVQGVHNPDLTRTLTENQTILLEQLPDLTRLILRDCVWCQIEVRNAFYLHFGHDYYMYLGSALDSPECIRFATTAHLFVEDKVSPYLDWPTG